MEIESLLKILQASIAPCVLISGVGLILLSMSNRLARPIDRIYRLTSAFKTAERDDKEAIKKQIEILITRSRILQIGIGFLMVSIFLLSVIIFMTYSIFLFNLNLEYGIEISFAASLLCLIAALIFFLVDIQLTLKSVKIEVESSLS